ncbi:MAG TPA: hypothetical protein VGS09_12095 [Actinomycetota bacterium]|nr:hypothetical protein [Actinomycetota bacterium]
MAAAPTASQWLAPVIIVLAVTLLGWLVLENQVPLDLAAAEQRLARMEAILRSTDQSGEVRDADLASAERRSRLCQEGLRSMVRMWNQYVRELREADVGSSAKFRAAKRRFDEAQKKASLAVRRCEDA